MAFVFFCAFCEASAASAFGFRSRILVLESRPMPASRAFYFAYFWFPDSGGRVARA